MDDKESTTLQWAAELARRDRGVKFRSLACKIGVEFLREAYGRLADKAPGIDGAMKAEYSAKLEENLAALHRRLKEQKYQAPPVRRVLIPKDEHSTRALGLPTLEDKIVQGAVKLLLEAIYEQDFYDCSYGFRPQRSCHDAIKEVRTGIAKKGLRYVIDADNSKCFDSFDKQHLREFIGRRVVDGSMIRLIGKWLNAGVMDGSEVIYPERGTPQGGVISPLLANIYLHYVLDEWFEMIVRRRCAGRVSLVRYCDDFVIACEQKSDADRIMRVLPQRFGKYGLTIHSQKTRLVEFTKPSGDKQEGRKTFNFLGFTFYWGRSRKGYWVVQKTTAKERLSRAKKRIHEWCKNNRHRPVKEQRSILEAKLSGHYNYYGVIGNYTRLKVIYNWTTRFWQKWLNRRGAKKPLKWKRFHHLLTAYPLPPPKIMHGM